MSAIDRFAISAKEFVEWCDSSPTDPPAEERKALGLLLDLCGGAVGLKYPDDMDYDLEGKQVDDLAWERVLKRTRGLPFGGYSIVFDPHSFPSEEPVIADLGDDIADIYRDLSEGLSLHADGNLPEAEWTFLHSFETHWGRHATAAIRALHCWIADNGDE